MAIFAMARTARAGRCDVRLGGGVGFSLDADAGRGTTAGGLIVAGGFASGLGDGFFGTGATGLMLQEIKFEIGKGIIRSCTRLCEPERDCNCRYLDHHRRRHRSLPTLFVQHVFVPPSEKPWWTWKGLHGSTHMMPYEPFGCVFLDVRCDGFADVGQGTVFRSWYAGTEYMSDEHKPSLHMTNNGLHSVKSASARASPRPTSSYISSVYLFSVMIIL